jgi:CsoR family transcriptional regulator, copper-sensing transcriptional repressor
LIGPLTVNEGIHETMQDNLKIARKKRLGRIKGQIRGIVRMRNENRYCIDVVMQIAAARAAPRRLKWKSQRIM